MAATCPAGHESATDDYCDTCGAPIGEAAEPAGEGGDTGATASGGNGAPDPAGAPTGAPAAGATCPACGEPVTARFCESCGYDVESGAPAAPAPVKLVLGADRAHWERMVGEGEPAFPAAVPALTLELTGDRMVLGRIRTGATVDVDLALTGSAADPAVSHHQCRFDRDEAGWVITDLDSANGTWINDAEGPLADGVTHRLAEGDRILMGAWTCLTVHGVPTAASPAPPAPPAGGDTAPSDPS